jgi:type II secretory ATPase GspE/PulE/Tfp pilus assembly ATPase PilB-like protein
VNPAARLTFASALRTVLRQDPDIIMVGEIRDTETARLAVQAAMTGHLVFSTLHANDASSVMNRLKDLEVPPFLIGSTVAAAISQRLVRRICPDCAQPCEVPPGLLSGTHLEGVALKHGAGCDLCMGTGYRGRLGVFEILPISEEIRDAFLHDASSDALRVIGRQQGFFTMRDAAIEAVRGGLTTVEEIRRILPAEELKA